MKLISFVWNKNYIYIFIITIILFINDFYNNDFINGIINIKKNKEYNYLINIFNMIGQFLNIILFYKFKKVQTENSIKKIQITKKKIDMNKNQKSIITFYHIKTYYSFNIIIIFYISLIEFCDYIYKDCYLNYYLNNKISKKDDEHFYEYVSLEPLSLFILYHIIFYKKKNINKFQKISINFVIIILIITFCINLYYNNFFDNFCYLINNIILNLIRNLKLIILKYLIEYYYFDGFYLNGYAAIITIILYSLEYFLKQYYKIGIIIKNIFKIIFSYNFFYLPIYIVFNFFINIYMIIIISDNPVYFGFIRLLKIFLRNIFYLLNNLKSNNKLINAIIEFIISIFLLIIMFIYCEFLQINFANINKDTKKNIQKRAENEMKIFQLED